MHTLRLLSFALWQREGNVRKGKLSLVYCLRVRQGEGFVSFYRERAASMGGGGGNVHAAGMCVKKFSVVEYQKRVCQL